MAPSLVQSASNTGTGSAVTVTLGAGTTAGNCLVVAVGTVEGTTNPVVSGITLGGGADHFAAARSQNNNADTNAEIWTDQNCAGGQTSVVVTFTGGTGTNPAAAVWVMEWSGVATSSAVDAVNGQNGSGTSFSSLSSGTLAQASEVVIGVVSAATTSITITAPGAPWTELGTLSPIATFKMAAGWQVVAATTGQTYSGSLSGSAPVYGAAVVTLLAAVPVVPTEGAAEIRPGPVWSRQFKPQMRRPVPVPLSPPALNGVVNAWSATFAQPSAFTTTPPALQSTVIALTAATSAGVGTGVPSPGNWLFCLAGWNQAGLPAVTAGDADDIHSFWRPGDVTSSTWAVSPSSASTRCSIWYTANLARAPGDVYAAPSGAMAGMACLVVEVAGLGPWDVVTGIDVAYAAAATSLNLALSAPPAASFVIAAVCGDSAAAGQAFTPGSPWQALPAVSAGNGTDHTCDAVLTSAYLLSNASSVSVNGTAGSATDLSGVIISVQVAAPSPVPAGGNQAWAGRMILEAAFGAGMETPHDQMTWTALSDNAWTSMGQGYKRFWGWQDSSGVPYALGQLQSGTGAVQLDNADGLVSPSNAASPFFPDLQPGTPLRLRMALGTLTDGTAVNRWYTWQRDALAFPEKRNKALRGYVPVTLTDVWGVVAGSGPTPYRGEVEQDAPYAWWPCDDQPLTAGVLPTSLRNAAAGNPNVLNITKSPNGIVAQLSYTVGGSSLGVSGDLAGYAVAASQGWMYGDPQSSPQSAATGNPVTASPGSAAWQAAGQAGNTGSYGWFLSCNDANFPVLANGVTVEGWFDYLFLGTANLGTPPGGIADVVAEQPVCPLTLIELATGSNPVAVLQLDNSGHLNLITYNGASGTSHAIYTSSDLRSESWMHVAVELTTTTWTVYVNGGLTAKVSGSATGMTSAWTWLIANGDLGTHGGSPAGTGLVHGANVSVSHLAVYPVQLPAWRILAHYCAAATGFGLLPAPTAVSAQFLSGPGPDGTFVNNNYGVNAASVMSAVVTAIAGSVTSGPSAYSTAVVQDFTITAGQGDGAWISWAGVAPAFSVFTASQLGAEKNAATVCGPGDWFTQGYGSGASGAGVCQTAAGTNASPPAAASSLGDTVAQRIERCLGYGRITRPNRAIDSSAGLLVQAALDVGGQQTGANLQNLVDSDNGLLFVDNNGTLCYRSRARLAADQAIWRIGMNTLAGMVPFDGSIEWSSDPQRIWDAITVTPYSPDGASLAGLTPANAAAANTAQTQFGARPKAVTSYLQDQTKMQAQADWYLANFAALQRRASVVAIDAASYPAAWAMVAGMNPGDIAQIYDAPLGQPATTGNYRVSQISRSVSFGANGSKVEARLVLVLDPLPTTYWS
jgi:hypothetical protein